METYVKHLLADKDWDGFLEIFGIPKPTITMPEGTPKGPEGDAYRDAATALAEAGYGALPHGSEVHYPTESGMNGSPFNERVGALRERMVLAGTGGLLTMITAPTGIGKGPSEQHADAFKALARKSAREIGEIFQRQFDGPFRKMEFPGQPVLAWFELCQESESENGVIADVKDLAAAGFIVDPDEVEERTGYTVTRAQQPAQPSAASQTLLDQMTGGGTPPAPDSRGTGNGAGNTDAKGNLRNRFVTDPAAGDALTPAGRAIAQSMADDFAGLRSELEIIIELAQDSPDLAMKALKKWNDRLPARAEKLLKNPRAAAAFEKMFLDAMNVGLHKLPP
jgi:hypothetical protein